MNSARCSALRSLLFSTGVTAVAFFGALSAAAQSPAPATRITKAIDETNLVTLKGNTHPLARAEFDQGAAPDNEPADRIQLLLKRSPQQEAALRQLLDEQKSSASPNFHQWLTPEQFGQQYGPADSDVQTITTWLTSHGFTVNRISAGRTVIEFSGNAGQIREAFHTQIHKYMVNGKMHWANSTDPQIPEALTPVVAGPVTLHNFGRKALHVVAGKIDAPKVTADATSPELTAFCGGTPCYLVGPADFSAIYNTAPLWTAGIDGTNQTIAIVGDSNIVCSDVTNFRNFFGLPVSAAQSSNNCTQATSNVQIILNGPDPGLNDDEIEADLDVQWSGAVAKGAHIDFVTSEATEVSQGVDLSAEYIIDNDLAPVMSESFGDCEGDLGNGGNDYYASLWEQAAAEGITVMVSAGDSGSAGCDDDNSEAVSFDGLAVSGITSTPFNVSVGGTDFNDFTNQTTYWNPAPNGGYTPGTSQQSVKGYVPEIPWDDSCAASSLTGCNGLVAGSSLANIVAGGGGQSNCAELNTFGTECTGYYPRPSWQKGAAVTNTLATQTNGPRSVPDVSLFAAAGSGSNSFYPICESDQNSGNAACTAINDFTGVGGTSSSSPAFAGIMAMVNQYMLSLGKPAKQGNANYELYTLASNQVTTPPSGGCNSTSGPNPANTTGCTFYDITIGSNSVPCLEGFGCSIQNTNATSPGVLEEVNLLTGVTVSPATLGWQAGTGYDMATGLGSVNAYNLVHNWPAVVGAFTPSATTVKLCTTAATPVCVSGGGNTSGSPLTFTHGATINATVSAAPNPGSGTPTGDASLIGTPNTLANNSGSSSAGVDYFTVNESTDDVFNFDVYTLSGGTVSGPTTSLIGGTYAITAHYSGDGTFGASDSSPIYVSVSPESSTTTITSGFEEPTDGNSVTTPSYGDVDVIRVDVVGASGDENTSGNVNMTDNGSAFGCPANPCQLNTEGNLEIQAGVNVIPTLTTGAHSFQAAFQGNASYSASTSATGGEAAFTVAKAATATSVAASPATVAAGQSTTLTATVSSDSIGVAPSGTVTFFAGGTAITSGTVAYARTNGSLLGTPLTGGTLATVTATLTYSPSATTTITAEYVAGSDPNYTSSAVSSGVTLTAGSTFSVTSPNSTQGTAVVIASPGMSGASTLGVTLAAGTASVTLSASLTMSPTGAIDLPTCSFAPNPVTASGNVTMTCNTTAAGVPPAPVTRPTLRGTPIAWLAAMASALIAILLLLTLPERRRGYALLIFVLVLAAGIGVACGGGGGISGNGGGGGGGGATGTTVGFYEYTVSGTPAGGTVTVWFDVE
jgi:subtilase family serine protease